MKMKTSLLAIAAVLPALATVEPAHAADYGLAPASYDWSGGYVGLNAGMGFNMSSMKSNYAYTGSDDPSQLAFATPEEVGALSFGSDPTDSSFTGGVVAGYNWQLASFVVGLEGDLNYLGFSGRKSHNVDDTINGIITTPTTNNYDTFDYETNWFGTVRARLGYAFDNILVYGTGGLAYGNMSVNQNLSTAVSSESIRWSSNTDGWKFGWTLGGGMEYGIDRWTLGAEYLYVDLGSYDWSAMPSVSLDSANSSAEAEWSKVKQNGTMDYRFGVARASLKYRF